MGALLEIAIGQTLCFSFAIGFDEANLRSELVESIFQRGADRLILLEIEHYRRGLGWGGGARTTPWPVTVGVWGLASPAVCPPLPFSVRSIIPPTRFSLSPP